MALIKCYECEKEISDKAPACPHCGAPKEEQPPQIEEAEILESVAAVDEPESITQEIVSAPSTDPEPVATKDKRFNKVVAIPGAPMINKLAEALTTMGFSRKGAVKLTLVLVFGTVVFAGLGEVFSGSQRDARWAHTPVNVRSGRSTADPIATGLERGERVEVDSLVDGWFRVFRNGQPIGYSASSVLNEGPPSSGGSVTEENGESPASSRSSAANYPSSIDSWLTEWSTRQATSIQETCRAEPECDPDEYAASARPETSFGWDGAQSVQQTEDWARGPRYQVTANGRSVLMYIEEGDVVSVDLYTSDGGRTNLCRDNSCE